MGKSRELATELAEKEYLLLEIEMKAFMRVKEELDSEEYFVRKVDFKDFDYSFDKKWEELDKESRKVYKEKKNREYDLRMKIAEDAKKEDKDSERLD